MLRNDQGFTLIEILAVLIILGIIAAVGVPRYIGMLQQSKISAAKAEVAEMKATLNLAYSSLYMQSGIAPETTDDVITQAGFTSGIPANVGETPDIWNVMLTAVGTGIATVDVLSRNADHDYAATGTWNLPRQGQF